MSSGIGRAPVHQGMFTGDVWISLTFHRNMAPFVFLYTCFTSFRMVTPSHSLDDFEHTEAERR